MSFVFVYIELSSHALLTGRIRCVCLGSSLGSSRVWALEWENWWVRFYSIPPNRLLVVRISHWTILTGKNSGGCVCLPPPPNLSRKKPWCVITLREGRRDLSPNVFLILKAMHTGVGWVSQVYLWFLHSKLLVIFHCQLCLLQDFCNLLSPVRIELWQHSVCWLGNRLWCLSPCTLYWWVCQMFHHRASSHEQWDTVNAPLCKRINKK